MEVMITVDGYSSSKPAAAATAYSRPLDALPWFGQHNAALVPSMRVSSYSTPNEGSLEVDERLTRPRIERWLKGRGQGTCQGSISYTSLDHRPKVTRPVDDEAVSSSGLVREAAMEARKKRSRRYDRKIQSQSNPEK